MSRRVTAVLAVLCAVLALPAAPVLAGDAASAATGSSTATVTAAVPGRTLTALAGFRHTSAGKVLNPSVFTTLATVRLNPSTTATTRVIAVRLSVTGPIREALSVLAWCRPGAVAGSTFVGAAADVLVIGQNPVTGSAATAVASRRLDGRAVVDVPAGQPVTCAVAASPRTETYARSWLRIVSGSLSVLAPTRVFARAAQRPDVLVGRPTSPGSTGRAVPVRAVATTATAIPPAGTSRVRAQGDLEVTTCALGYHLCARGTSDVAVVDARLRVVLRRPSGAVCAMVDGPSARVTITPAVHHLKLLVPALVTAATCGADQGTTVSGQLVVTHVRGNAVEVEPSLGGGRVQTHVWLEAVA